MAWKRKYLYLSAAWNIRESECEVELCTQTKVLRLLRGYVLTRVYEVTTQANGHSISGNRALINKRAFGEIFGHKLAGK